MRLLSMRSCLTCSGTSPASSISSLSLWDIFFCMGLVWDASMVGYNCYPFKSCRRRFITSTKSAHGRRAMPSTRSRPAASTRWAVVAGRLSAGSFPSLTRDSSETKVFPLSCRWRTQISTACGGSMSFTIRSSTFSLRSTSRNRICSFRARTTTCLPSCRSSA